MRCLVVADIHYSLRQFDWLVGEAPHFDLVVIAGDLLEIASTVDRRAQIVVVRAYLEKLSALTRVIVCSGNHDLDASHTSGEKRAAWMDEVGLSEIGVDGQAMRIGDTLVTICAWWDGPATKDEIAALLARDAAIEKDHWIWVYHAPPADSPVSWAGSRHFGDRDLVAWIEEFGPDIVFSGHVHQSPFIAEGSWVDRIGDTWVFNTGRQPGDLPAHIIIDEDEAQAVWFSMEGAQIVSLDGPLTRPVEQLTALPEWLRA